MLKIFAFVILAILIIVLATLITRVILRGYNPTKKYKKVIVTLLVWVTSPLVLIYVIVMAIIELFRTFIHPEEEDD